MDLKYRDKLAFSLFCLPGALFLSANQSDITCTSRRKGFQSHKLILICTSGLFFKLLIQEYISA